MDCNALYVSASMASFLEPAAGACYLESPLDAILKELVASLSDLVVFLVFYDTQKRLDLALARRLRNMSALEVSSSLNSLTEMKVNE